MRCNGSNWAVYPPRDLRWFQEWCMSIMSRGNNAPWAPLSWWIRALYKSIYYYYYYTITRYSYIDKMTHLLMLIQDNNIRPSVFYNMICLDVEVPENLDMVRFFYLFPAHGRTTSIAPWHRTSYTNPNGSLWLNLPLYSVWACTLHSLTMLNSLLRRITQASHYRRDIWFLNPCIFCSIYYE